MVKLDGSRIYLRDHVTGDFDSYFDWISDPNVMQHLTWATSDKSVARQNLYAAISDANSPDLSRYFFAIVEKRTDEVVGDVGFTIVARGPKGGIADLGYFLRLKYFGMGYGFEASQRAVAYAFETLGLHKVIASCAIENIASERLMIRLGMKKEGTFRSEYFHDGRWKDRVRYAALREEWKALQG